MASTQRNSYWLYFQYSKIKSAAIEYLLVCYYKDMKYGLFGKFVVHEGKRDEMVGILLQAADLLKQNVNCISYVVGTSNDPSEIWVSELWTNKEAHDSSLEPENIRSLIMTARPLIKEMPDGTEYVALGGKGF